MFKKFRKALAVSIALTLVIGLAVFAQPQQGKNGQKQKAGIAGQQNQGAGTQGFGGGQNKANKKEYYLRMASLQRILMPPGLGELQKLGIALSLTDAQKEQVKALFKQFRETVKPVCQERGTAVQGVLTALSQPSPSKGDLQSAANPVFQADKTIVDAEFDFWIAFKGILNTPQQQQATSQFLQQRALGEMGGGQMGQQAGPGGQKNPKGQKGGGQNW